MSYNEYRRKIIAYLEQLKNNNMKTIIINGAPRIPQCVEDTNTSDYIDIDEFKGFSTLNDFLKNYLCICVFNQLSTGTYGSSNVTSSIFLGIVCEHSPLGYVRASKLSSTSTITKQDYVLTLVAPVSQSNPENTEGYMFGLDGTVIKVVARFGKHYNYGESDICTSSSSTGLNFDSIIRSGLG